MAIAGKVAITPKGEWNADTTYEKLDLVFYENASYVATKPSTGVLPTDQSYWMLIVQSAGGADLDGIISGDIQVGNAKTLDGNEVDAFAKAVDLSNYFPKSGGTVANATLQPLIIKNNSDGATMALIKFAVNTNLNMGCLGFDGNDSPIFYSVTTGAKKLLHTGNMANHVLPLTGGAVNGRVVLHVNGYDCLGLVNNSNFNAMISFKGTNGNCGALGFINVNKPVVMNDTQTAFYDIHHAGNKPTGTYTGNGDVTNRRIDTGGIGTMVVIRNSNTHDFVIMTAEGYIGKQGTSFVGGTDSYWSIGNNAIMLNSVSALLNASGVTYTYHVY